MTLPADTRLNDTEPGGLLTAADFDHWTSRETAMLIGHDTEFVDTMALPRRQSVPMDFTPREYEAVQARWNRGHVAACQSDACLSGRKRCPTPDACRIPADSDYGALEGLVKGRVYVIAPWAVLALLALAAMLVWG